MINRSNHQNRYGVTGLLLTLLALFGTQGSIHAGYDYDFFCRTDTIQRIGPCGLAKFYFTIQNTGTECDCYEFNCRVIQEVPDWFVMYCVGGLCALPGLALCETLAAGETDTLVDLMVAADTSSGEEIVVLSVQSTGNPALTDSQITYTILGMAVGEQSRDVRATDLQLTVVPNPACGQAFIRYQITEIGRENHAQPTGSLELYDALGRRRLTVSAAGRTSGHHELLWQRPKQIPSGVYYLVLTVGTQSDMEKFVLEE